MRQARAGAGSLRPRRRRRITRTFAPGFRVSACAHLLHMLPQSIVHELALPRHGLALASATLPTTALVKDGAPIAVIEGEVMARLRRMAAHLAPLMAAPPPRLGHQSLGRPRRAVAYGVATPQPGPRGYARIAAYYRHERLRSGRGTFHRAGPARRAGLQCRAGQQCRPACAWHSIEFAVSFGGRSGALSPWPSPSAAWAP